MPSGMLAASLNVDTFGQFLGAGIKFPELGAGAWDWNPLDALGDIAGGLPKLLGSLELTDLIPNIEHRRPRHTRRAAGGQRRAEFDHPTIPEIPTGVCFHFTWEPKLRSFPERQRHADVRGRRRRPTCCWR